MSKKEIIIILVVIIVAVVGLFFATKILIGTLHNLSQENQTSKTDATAGVNSFGKTMLTSEEDIKLKYKPWLENSKKDLEGWMYWTNQNILEYGVGTNLEFKKLKEVLNQNIALEDSILLEISNGNFDKIESMEDEREKLAVKVTSAIYTATNSLADLKETSKK